MLSRLQHDVLLLCRVDTSMGEITKIVWLVTSLTDDDFHAIRTQHCRLTQVHNQSRHHWCGDREGAVRNSSNDPSHL